MTDNIFTVAVESVERRGFHSTIQHERFANAPVMAAFLTAADEFGNLARAMRKGSDTDVHIRALAVAVAMEILSNAMMNQPDSECAYAHEPFLMQQYTRSVEESGELAAAYLADDAEAARYEIADCTITQAQQAHLLGFDMEHAIRNKLTLDEVRGYLHGQTQTDVNGSG